MSTVIAAIRGGAIHVCGDTAGMYNDGIMTHTNKVYEGGDYLVGTCGIRDPYLTMYYEFNLPPNVGLSRVDYIAGTLRPLLKQTLSHVEKDSFSLVLGFYYAGEPCLIQVNADVSDIEDVSYKQWVCMGTGQQVAMGVMDTLWDTDMDTRAMMEKGIEVAARYNAYTRLPSVYHCLPGGECVA